MALGPKEIKFEPYTTDTIEQYIDTCLLEENYVRRHNCLEINLDQFHPIPHIAIKQLCQRYLDAGWTTASLNYYSDGEFILYLEIRND